MKKIFRIFYRIIFICLILLAGAYLWISQGWRISLSDKDLKDYSTQIQSIPLVPESLSAAYNTLYPLQKETTIRKEIYYQFLSLFIDSASYRDTQCPCIATYHYSHGYTYLMEKSGFSRIKQLQFLFGIENYLSNEDCLNYNLYTVFHELNTLNLGFSYEGKSLRNLSDKDIIDFLIAEKLPFQYSPFRKPKKYSARKRYVSAKLNPQL